MVGSVSTSEADDLAAQAAELGLPPEEQSRLQQMGQRYIEVLEENWTAVSVYARCQSTVVGLSGVSGVRLLHLGVSAQEAEAAVRMLRVPRREWPDVLQRVQVMSAAAANHLNGRRA